MKRMVASLILLVCVASTLAMGQVPTGGLVAYYPFNGNASDATGNGNAGVVFGGVSLRTDRFGNPNAALQFNGTGYITVSNSTSLQVGRFFTMAFWFRVTGQGAADWMGMVTKSFATKYYDAGPRAMVSQENRTGPFLFKTMAPPPYDTAQAVVIELNRWYYFTITGAGDSIRQYLDDRLVFRFPQDPSWTFSNSNPLTLGSQIGNFEGRNLNGALDEVRIYNRALSGGEVTALYLEGSGLAVQAPDTTAMPGKTVEIPIYVDDLTTKEVLSYEFTLNVNSPDSILGEISGVETAGTLSAASGWSVLPNTSIPNQVTVGAFGANPLAGGGVLVKVLVKVNDDAAIGKFSVLHFSDFVFNSGVPSVSATNGKVTVRTITCGDADENGLVQAYDAALTLREAIGPLPAPPDPLTSQGILNADVDQNAKTQAYDAALILRHILQLPMPQGVSTCFTVFGKTAGFEPKLANFGLKFDVALQQSEHPQAVLQGSGLTPDVGVIALSFDISLGPTVHSSSLTLSTMPDGYLAMVHRFDDQRFRVGIINPHGINSHDLRLVVDSPGYQDIAVTNILLNETRCPDIHLSRLSLDDSPLTYDLVGAFPNPFNPSTRIVFQIPENAPVLLEVYSANGMKVKTLVNQEVAKGRHEVTWNGLNDAGRLVSSGQYFCRMKTGAVHKVIKLMTIK